MRDEVSKNTIFAADRISACVMTKNMYLACFAAVVIVLAVVKCACPQVAGGGDERLALAEKSSPEADPGKETEADKQDKAEVQEKKRKETAGAKADSAKVGRTSSSQTEAAARDTTRSKFFDSEGNPVKHRIWSVPSYREAFPDSNSVQMASALKHGVQPVDNRTDAESRKKELVYVGANPYYHVDRMYRSIPYLVPRAAVLLNDIGRAYYDSLQIKGVPLHQFIVTSVLRTKDDVVKLRNYNHNATENSCHLYGTTFDICYNRYEPVGDPDGPAPRAVRNDTLKWILCEVLDDMRSSGRCYIKYEVKQGCFHITVR